MKIHEYQAAQMFKDEGIPVPIGEVASGIEEAQSIAGTIGYPVVLKSQVLVGGRGKAGGIKVVKDAEELKAEGRKIFGLNIKGYTVEKVYVVKAVKIVKEFYVAVTVDGAQNDVVLIASSEGGVEIEETAKANPDAIKKFYLNREKNIDQSRWGEFIQSVFPDKVSQAKGVEIFQKLLNIFYTNDCSLVEVNPFVIDDKGEWCAADAKINFDDNALYRQEAVQGMRDVQYEDPDELEAKENGLSFVKLDGNVGCIVNGAGLAMATMDIVKLLGGNPANFLDVGGSSSPEKVVNALNIILRNKKVKAILINIFGGITRCDDIAKGILEAQNRVEMKVPLVVRLTGTNEEEAKKIMADAGMGTYPSMRAAVQKAVELAGKA